MQSGDPFAPFFAALQQFNELVFRGGNDAVAQAYRRNLDAIEHANRVIMDGTLDASRRQAEILRKTMEDIAQAAQTVLAAKSPGDAAQAQVRYVEDAVGAAVDRMRELNEAMAKANTEALEVLRDRLIASFEEAVDVQRDSKPKD